MRPIFFYHKLFQFPCGMVSGGVVTPSGRFLNRCEAAGVEVRIKQTRTGKIQGIAYALGEEEVKGSELKGLSFEKLMAAGVTYDPARDEKAIALAADKYSNGQYA